MRTVSVSVHEGGARWSVFVNSDTWRGWVDIDVADGVPVVLDVQPADERLSPPALQQRAKPRRRRPGLGWSVVGELLEM